LLSAAASLTGAGAYLATVEIIYRMTGERMGFGQFAQKMLCVWCWRAVPETNLRQTALC
jgi:hypothetical protein